MAMVFISSISTGEIPHEDACNRNAQDQSNGEIIGEKRDVAQLSDDNLLMKRNVNAITIAASLKRMSVWQYQKNRLWLQGHDERTNGLDEETHVPQDDDEHRPMKEKREEPEPLGARIDGASS